MHLEIEQRQREGIVILDLKGRLTLGPEDAVLRQRLQELRESGRLKVILNLKDVTEMDTGALGTLVFCASKFREAGGRLVLLHLSPTHGQLSNIVKLNTMFDIYSEEVEALNSFFPERVVPRYDILEFLEEMEQKRHGDRPQASEGQSHEQTRRGTQEVSK